MLSAAVRAGSRLYAWNTKPTRSRRSRVSRRSGSVVISVPPIHTCPPSALSSPAMQCISVDLPDPDGPMMAVKVPVPISRQTWSSAVTRVGPSP